MSLPNRKLEYADLPDTLDDGKRYELVRGELCVTPSPRFRHQAIAKRLFLVLVNYFEGRRIGEVYFAPVDVILTDHDVFVPDLIVVSDSTRITERAIESPPLLIVEILSPSTRARDLGLKRERYAELGVEHYWIVDPDREALDCQRLDGGSFQSVARAEGSSTLRHPDWGRFEIDLATLWSV